MTTVEQTSPAEAYLAAVASALTGVAEPDRQDLLDDLADHLAELAAEDGPDLEARLGPPDRYAAELVASAGIAVPQERTPPPSSLPSRARTAVTAAWDSQWARAVRAFLPELQAGWWVLRAWTGLALLTVAVDGGAVYPVPAVVGNPFVSLVALGAAVVGSVRLGRRGGRPDRLLTWVGALGVLVALGNGSTGRDVVYHEYDTPGGYGNVLLAPDGRVVSNIWPFDADGNVIDGVFLYDQDGVPLGVGQTGSENPTAVPGLFPQDQVTDEYDDRTGTVRRVPVTAPAVSLPRLPASSSTSTSTSTSTTAPIATTAPTAPAATPPPSEVPSS